MDKTYNGWKNYETWLVNLWIDNDGDGEQWRERAAGMTLPSTISPRYRLRRPSNMRYFIETLAHLAAGAAFALWILFALWISL